MVLEHRYWLHMILYRTGSREVSSVFSFFCLIIALQTLSCLSTRAQHLARINKRVLATKQSRVTSGLLSLLKEKQKTEKTNKQGLTLPSQGICGTLYYFVSPRSYRSLFSREGGKNNTIVDFLQQLHLFTH